MFIACDYLGGGHSSRPADGDFMTLAPARSARQGAKFNECDVHMDLLITTSHSLNRRGTVGDAGGAYGACGKGGAGAERGRGALGPRGTGAAGHWGRGALGPRGTGGQGARVRCWGAGGVDFDNCRLVCAD